MEMRLGMGMGMGITIDHNLHSECDVVMAEIPISVTECLLLEPDTGYIY